MSLLCRGMCTFTICCSGYYFASVTVALGVSSYGIALPSNVNIMETGIRLSPGRTVLFTHLDAHVACKTVVIVNFSVAFFCLR